MEYNEKILKAIRKGLTEALADNQDIDLDNLNQKRAIDNKYINDTLKRLYEEKMQELIPDYTYAPYYKPEWLDELAEWHELYGVTYKPKDDREFKKIIKKITKRKSCLNKSLNWIDTSDVTDMAGIFYGLDAPFDGDISEWDVSNVKDMANMFGYGLYTKDLSNWKINPECNCSLMFSYCNYTNFKVGWLPWNGEENMNNVFSPDTIVKNPEYKHQLEKWIDDGQIKSLAYIMMMNRFGSVRYYVKDDVIWPLILRFIAYRKDDINVNNDEEAEALDKLRSVCPKSDSIYNVINEIYIDQINNIKADDDDEKFIAKLALIECLFPRRKNNIEYLDYITGFYDALKNHDITCNSKLGKYLMDKQVIDKESYFKFEPIINKAKITFDD